MNFSTGKYEKIGTTAVGKFLYAQADAPPCERQVERGASGEVREAYRYALLSCMDIEQF